jgi:uncharacterized protein
MKNLKLTSRQARFITFLVLMAVSITVVNTTLAAAPKIPPAPRPAKSINDFANILGQETSLELEELGAKVWERTGSDVVLVTVPTLDGASIEEYALALFRGWGLGDKEKNSGVLLLVDKERLMQEKSGKVRIEVGYGLEGAIPDGKAGRILDEMVLPLWEERDYDGGIKAGYMALLAAVATEYGIDLEADGELTALIDYDASSVPFTPGFFTLWLAILLIIIIISLIGAFLRRHNRYQGFPWLRPIFNPRSRRPRSPFDDFFGGGPSGGFGGGGFSGRGGFGGGSSGGGGASR